MVFKMEITRKLYLDKLDKLINTPLIKVIIGVRRSGKTFLLKSIQQKLINLGIKQENIIYISFESMNYDEITDHKMLNKYIKKRTQNLSGKIYFLFDEIQNVKNWEKSINAYRVDFDSDIYITGSNSNLLSGELSTMLSGRYIELKVFPFSFKEVLEYKKINNKKIDKNKVFKEYFKFGGFPEIMQIDDSLKENYLDSLHDSIILRDIISRHDIRDVDMLKRLLDFIIENAGQTFSANSISKYFKKEKRNVSVNKIANYLEYTQNSNMIYKCQREDLIGKKVLSLLEKYYIVDQGLYYRLPKRKNKNYGQILENIVYIELLRRDYKINIGKVENLEVDFVCQKNEKIIYVQVSESIIDENTRKREFKPFEKIKDYYPKYVITNDNFDYSEKGIIHLNIIDFLLDETI